MEIPYPFEIDTQIERLPVEEIHAFLNTTYWAEHRSLETVKTSLANSMNFGLYHNGALAGFARVVTDKVIFAYLCDVFILPEYRGQGLGKLLMYHVHHHPELKTMRRWFLATKDAHGLYNQSGYTALEKPERWMELFRSDL